MKILSRPKARNTLLWISLLASCLITEQVLGQTTVPRSSAYKYSQPIEPSFTDISYASLSPSEKFDLYMPAGRHGPTPLVIWIHGGAFRVGDKHSMPRRDFGPPPASGPKGPFQIQVPDVAALIAKGYAVVSLNYRLLHEPGTAFQVYALPAVQDGKAAVRYLRANAAKYNLDPNKFAVWGNSAGGFIAAMLAVTGDQPTIFDDPSLGNSGVSSAVQAAVIWYGAIENEHFRPEIRISHYIATAKVVPPFLISNGDADSNVSAVVSQQLNEKLIVAGKISTLRIVPNAGHEDPAFMATQMLPTFVFLDGALGQ
jgi:acetyl esterase/lipase